jgi:hypothetical protein
MTKCLNSEKRSKIIERIITLPITGEQRLDHSISLLG